MDINHFAFIFVPTFIFGELIVRAVLAWRQRDRQLPAKDVFSNFMIGLGDRLTTTLFWTGIMLAVFRGIEKHVTPFAIDMNHWWAWPLAIVLSDLAFYCYHRAGHEVRLFWAVHNVHHSSRFYNFSTSVRLSWFEGLLRWPFWMILPLAGFTTEVTMIAYMVVRLYQVLLHNEFVSKLGIFEWFLSTPSHHRVHHGRNEQYLDKNYGGITILWDRLLGTFEEEQEKVDYGLVKNLESHNLLWINVHEFVAIARDVKRSRNWTEAFLYVFGKPGWSPSASVPDDALQSVLAAI